MWEWTLTGYGSGNNNDITNSTVRVLRGGSGDYGPRGLRAAARGRYGPDDGDVGVGFRCVREVIP